MWQIRGLSSEVWRREGSTEGTEETLRGCAEPGRCQTWGPRQSPRPPGWQRGFLPEMLSLHPFAPALLPLYS